MSLRIIPGDHEPPHVHVVGPGWEMKVRLATPDEPHEILGKMKPAEVVAGLEAVKANVRELRKLWREVNRGSQSRPGGAR